MIKKTLLIILMAIITTILFILFTDINNNLILNWGDWEVLTSLTALVLIFLTYTLLLVLLIYLYSSLIRVKEKRILSKKIKNLSNSIDILNDLSFDISKNQLDIFINPIPRSYKEEKTKTFPMGTHVHEQGHGADRTGADRRGGQLDARTPPHRRHNASRAHTQLRSLARTNETKRFPGWPTPPTSDTSPCAKAKRLPKASKLFPQSQLA